MKTTYANIQPLFLRSTVLSLILAFLPLCSFAQGNYFAGTGAGTSNTTGSYNSFVGYQAGSNNTTGDFNSFLGSEAGFFNTTGYNNTFLGHSAGRFNTTGNRNVFIGDEAGFGSVPSTGSDN